MYCFHLGLGEIAKKYVCERERVSVGVFSPYSADTTCRESSWSNGRTLLHEPPYWEPETVPQGVLINEETTASLQAGVWIVPFVRGQPELQEKAI